MGYLEEHFYMKKILKKIIPTKFWKDPNSLYSLKFRKYAGKYYSQEGEDILLSKIFEDKETGFFVDVGAHHPKRFSNTFLLYQRGWHGINIDPLPGSMKLFKKIRPRDTNLEIAVSEKEQELTYYMFNEPALNGFSKTISMQHQNEHYKIKKMIKVPSLPLSKILANHLPKRQIIDVLNVDVEGLDLEVLKSNDWQNYIPKIILVEILYSRLNAIKREPIYNFLETLGYYLVSKLFHTCIFKSSD